MDKIRIRGGRRLQGEIHIGGSKNAALPLMACALLTDEPLVLGNVPRLADIATLSNLLADLGVEIRDVGAGANGSGRTVELRTARIRSTVAPYDLVRKMRASILVLGPLLVRAGHA
jgi:UDP-N-acetylglucosamine 1-carboxyvinyltransferase